MGNHFLFKCAKMLTHCFIHACCAIQKKTSLHNPHKGVNIFEIVEFFKKEQASTEIEIRQLMAGSTRRRQAPRQRNKVESKPL